MELVSALDAREKLRQIIIDKGLKWGEGLLKNKIPKWIFDLREVLLTPEGSKLASVVLYEKLKDVEFDMVGGPSIAAEPLTSFLLMHFYEHGRPISGFIVRKQPNDFGLRKKIEGPLKKGINVVLIDDSINSGSGLADSVDALKHEGCNIVKILTLIDFYYSGHKKLVEQGYDVESIFSLEDFGLEENRTYPYGTLKVKEIKSADGKDSIIHALNEYLDGEVSDVKLCGNSALVAYADGSVACLQLDKHASKWHLELGESITVPIVIDWDNAIVCANSGLRMARIFLISKESGRIVNTINTKGKISIAPLPHKDFFLVGSDDNKLHCVGNKQNSVIWELRLEGNLASSPAVDDDGMIFLNTTEGFICAVDFRGTIIWKRRIGTTSYSSPLVFSDTLVTLSGNNVLFCLDKYNGKIKWLYEMKNKAHDFEAISSKIYVGCANGYLVALDAKSGAFLECFKLFDQDIKKINAYADGIMVKDGDGKSYTIGA